MTPTIIDLPKTVSYDPSRTTTRGDTVEVWVKYQEHPPDRFNGTLVEEMLRRAEIVCNSNQVRTVGGEVLGFKGQSLTNGYQAIPDPKWQEATPDSFEEMLVEGVCIGEARWVTLNKNDSETTSFATDRIAVRGQFRDAWIRVSYVKPQAMPRQGKMLSAFVVRTRVDCASMRSVTIESVLEAPSGEPLSFEHTAPPSDESSWQTTTPGTAGELYNLSICRAG